MDIKQSFVHSLLLFVKEAAILSSGNEPACGARRKIPLPAGLEFWNHRIYEVAEVPKGGPAFGWRR